jgi:ornithine cyclodeaminase
MIVVSERAARALIGPEQAMAAIEEAFLAVAAQDARSFPVVRERFGPGPDLYGVKSGTGITAGVLGLKIGGYWTGNSARGLTNHQSTTVLTDPVTGKPRALVSSNHLTGMRTAAGCALAIRELARGDARTLGVIGAGAQALFHIQLACLARPFTRLLVSSRDPANARACADAARQWGLETGVADLETTAREADVLITITPSRAPLVRADWIRPGTHICAMGADTAGKQELDIALVGASRVYVDDWGQAASIGECQGAAREGLLDETRMAGTLGDLLAGKTAGRADDREITLFDSSGLAVQDLYIAAHALRAAEASPVDGVVDIDLR